jgi:hypothetical protein
MQFTKHHTVHIGNDLHPLQPQRGLLSGVLFGYTMYTGLTNQGRAGGFREGFTQKGKVVRGHCSWNRTTPF